MLEVFSTIINLLNSCLEKNEAILKGKVGFNLVLA